MSVAPMSDEDLLRRLPLPLAQLYRRARNGKTPVDRHHNAYYLAEATLKLAASARIGAALLAGLDHQSPLARSLEQLCLPSVGHWVGFLREASTYLRARPDAALLPLASSHEALARHEPLPAVREFAERASRGVDDEQPPIAPEAARQAAARGILGFFDLVAAYRNQVFGHGAQRPPAFYDELGGLLLAASAEVLRRDALFGGLTLAVARLTSGDSARSLRVEWQGLQGPASLMLPGDAVGPEPDPSEEAARRAAGRVYFVAGGVRVPLHPLVIYHEDRREQERVGFLNRTVEASRSAKGGEVRRCDYLDYATGDLIREADARRELTELLSRLRGRPADSGDVDRVILDSRAGSDEPPPPPDLAAGAIIGDFALEGELGRGGMGVVYRARQRSLNRTVALKVLPPSMAADPVSLGRFRREIAALARCEHPNLVKILTSGSDGDRHYYAMELVEGMDLAALFEVLASWNRTAHGRLREGHLPAAVSTSSDLARRRQESRDDADIAEPLPDLDPIPPVPVPSLESGRSLFEALGTVFADAADALAHLHARGIIHRDIKPANLMLTLDGRRLVVMDLGLAQLRDRSQSLTAAGAKFVGTLRYTSPEQLQRNLLEVDERADVYGLGATLYEMATLAPIFDGDTTNRLVEQVLHQEPKPPRSAEPAIPKDLAAITLHCLEKDRSQRYANVRDLAADLRHFARGKPVSVREPGRVERALRWARRKPTLAAAYTLGLLAILLGGLGGAAAWQWRTAVKARDGERRAREIAEKALGQEARATDGEKQARGIAENALGEEAKARREVETSREQLAAVEYGRTMQVAHQEWRDANIVTARTLLESTREEMRGWEWFYVHYICDPSLLTLTGYPGPVSSASFSPDGSRVVTASEDKTAKVWDARTGSGRLAAKGHTRRVFSASF